MFRHPGSAAIGAGDDAVCSTAAVASRDFFGRPRPLGQHCAVGAVEGADLEREAGILLRQKREISQDLLPVWEKLFPGVNPPAGTATGPKRPDGGPGSTGGSPKSNADRGAVTAIAPAPSPAGSPGTSLPPPTTDTGSKDDAGRAVPDPVSPAPGTTDTSPIDSK
jgi:hypothetical protein